MLETILVLLIILAVLGGTGAFVLGKLLYIVIVVAVVILAFRIISGRKDI